MSNLKSSQMKKIASLQGIVILLMLVIFFIVPRNISAQKECERQYKVTLTQVSSIPSGCTGVVKITVNGIVYTTPFVPGQSTYYFPEVNSYPQSVCPGITLSCGISAQNVACSYLSTRMPCGTYSLYSLQIGPPPIE